MASDWENDAERNECIVCFEAIAADPRHAKMTMDEYCHQNSHLVDMAIDDGKFDDEEGQHLIAMAEEMDGLAHDDGFDEIAGMTVRDWALQCLRKMREN